VATGVVNVYTRHPAVLAMAASTLTEQFGERFVLGLGPGSKLWMEKLGYSLGFAFSDTRECVRFLNDIWAGRASTLQMSHLETAVLEMRQQSSNRPPLVVSAEGPRMVALAATETAGALLAYPTADWARSELLVKAFRDAEPRGERTFGCATHCFIAGPEMTTSEKDSLRRLCSLLGTGRSPDTQPAYFEVSSTEAFVELLHRFQSIGLDELALIATHRTVGSVARMVRQAVEL
jgi:alkanesulfonate monooxygenase SsuD/methylene tetrahydromethanopterin reductase-like flavin-dependent oxidoreductase (luciferase family)